jgi:hypothetical protein
MEAAFPYKAGSSSQERRQGMSDEDAFKALSDVSGKKVKAKEKPSRVGKKAFAVFLDPVVIRQIKQICFEEEMTQQDFIAECLNLGFAKYGKGQIA